MAFQEFTGKEYLKIDIASNFGLDKLTWDERIEWFDKNEDNLRNMIKQAKEAPLFFAGILAWEAAKRGEPSGYPISLDATSSGIQILSCLMLCRATAELCNVIDVGKRMDAYTTLYQRLCDLVGDSQKIDREDVKQAIMTAFYNSEAVPREIFGEGTPMLANFFKTMNEGAPGAWKLNEFFKQLWNPKAIINSWVLPDNFHVHVKVMGVQTRKARFNNYVVDVIRKINAAQDNGRSLGANTIHSIDGYIVREMERRCNYDPIVVANIRKWLNQAQLNVNEATPEAEMLKILDNHYKRSGIFSARVFEFIREDNIHLVDKKALTDLLDSLPAKPFEVLPVHDCFRCLPNYGNDLRRQYNRQLFEIANSRLIDDLLTQIRGKEIFAPRMDESMIYEILDTNYALS